MKSSVIADKHQCANACGIHCNKKTKHTNPLHMRTCAHAHADLVMRRLPASQRDSVLREDHSLLGDLKHHGGGPLEASARSALESTTISRTHVRSSFDSDAMPRLDASVRGASGSRREGDEHMHTSAFLNARLLHDEVMSVRAAAAAALCAGVSIWILIQAGMLCMWVTGRLVMTWFVHGCSG
jgi:hypothetical protein